MINALMAAMAVTFGTLFILPPRTFSIVEIILLFHLAYISAFVTINRKGT